MERADRITKAGAVANMGMAALKGVVGTAAGSPALQADAVHSLSDLVSDGVSLWALHRARRPPDKHYPYGHGKFEAVGSACVGGMLVAAGGGMGIHALQAAVDLFSEARERGGERRISACGGGWSRRVWEDKKTRIDDGPDQVPELNGANTDR